MKKFLLFFAAGLLAVAAAAAPKTPESGKFYRVKHSSGLYLTQTEGSFKISQEVADPQTSHQVFQFTKKSNGGWIVQVDPLRYLASDNKWNASVMYRTSNEYAEFDVAVKNDYLVIKNWGQSNHKGGDKCYLGTDKNENNSAVYSDKAGNDGKHYWTLVEVEPIDFVIEPAGEDVYPDQDIPDDDPRKSAYPGYKLVFADEFSATDGSWPKMNPGPWTYETGYKRNNERQYYTVKADNVWQENGVCVINGRRETDYVKNGQNIPWTSTSMRTNTTNNKFNWLFGIFEIRAKLPAYEGMWPAIWSTGIGAWPKYGEIDLLEWYGGRIHGNVCFGDTQWISNTIDYATLNASDPNTEWGDEYHIWRMYWDYAHIEMWCDDLLVNNINLDDTYNPVSSGQAWSGKNPFRDVRHQIWLNLALGSSGGSLDHAPDNNYYLLDYARVYQRIGTDGVCLYYVDPYAEDATIKVPDKDAELGISSIMNDDSNDGEIEYYNLQGMRLQHPADGQVVIRRQGNKAEKVIF